MSADFHISSEPTQSERRGVEASTLASHPGFSSRRLALAAQEIGPPLVAFLLIGMVWEAIGRITRTPPYILPVPSAIITRLADELPYLVGEGLVTLAEALAGLALGAAVALTAAVLMSQFRLVERSLFPVAIAVKVTPMVAVAPLLVLWFGFGPLPKVIVAALVTYFPILSNALTGFRSVNPATLEFLASVHASKREVFFKLRLPQALPYLFASLKVAVGLSVIGAVVAEWIAADRGLGHVIIVANANLDMTLLCAAIAVLAILGVGLYLLSTAIERRLLFWHESQRAEQAGK